MTTYLSFLLHIYQPPWQDVDVLKKINAECYEPLFLMMDRHENAKFTLNIQGVLLDMLEKANLTNTITLIKNLYTSGKLEIAGSAKFHPILPMIPNEEISRQITLNETTLFEKLGVEKQNLRGFFPPEMAVSPKLCDKISSLGYSWMIMDGIANRGEWPINFFKQSESGLITLFRDNYTSNEISFNKITSKEFIKKISTMYGDNEGKDNYTIIAMDGETFGHHIKYYETEFLGKVLSILSEDSKHNVKILTISELLDLSNKGIFPVKLQKTQKIRSSTWSTMPEDIEADIPYPLWGHPLNPLHKYEFRMLNALYKLMELLEKNRGKINIESKKNHSFFEYYRTARYFYDRALHSCWLWWSSMRPHWSPNLIYNGIDLVMKTALNAQLALIDIKLGNGDGYYQTIVDNNEKVLNQMIASELAGQRVRSFEIE